MGHGDRQLASSLRRQARAYCSKSSDAKSSPCPASKGTGEIEEGGPTPSWVTWVTADVNVTLAACIQSSWTAGSAGMAEGPGPTELFICKICCNTGWPARTTTPPGSPHEPLLLNLFSLLALKELFYTCVS